MPLHDSRHPAPAFSDLAGQRPDSEDPTARWQVTSLVDPDGIGRDLAFTDGLAGLGQPELLLWARPTTGSDPGADWLLTHRERCRLLNRWAHELLDDRLRPGDEREERFDGGHTVARFHINRPRPAATLHLPYLRPEAELISVSWSLRRKVSAERAPTPLRPAVSRRMESWISAADAATLGWRLRLGTAEQTEVGARFERRAAQAWEQAPDIRFGPLSRWVHARVHQILAADSEVLSAFLSRLDLAGRVRCEDCLLERLALLATRARRNSACREACRIAQELAMAVTGPSGAPTSVWRRATAGLPLAHEPAFPGFSQAGHDRELPLDSALRTAFSDGLEVLLTAAVLTDLAPGSIIASATGPWAWAVNEQQVPGRHWLAPAAVRRTAREFLAAATPDLLALAAHRARSVGTAAAEEPVNLLVAGLQTTAAVAAHRGSLLGREQRRGLPRSVAYTADQLAGQLVTALAAPQRFPARSWAHLRETLRPLAPHLPTRLPVEVP